MWPSSQIVHYMTHDLPTVDNMSHRWTLEGNCTLEAAQLRRLLVEAAQAAAPSSCFDAFDKSAALASNAVQIHC